MSETDKNVSAFLKTIRECEGTAGQNGYKTLFGGGLFNDYSAHPNKKIPFRGGVSTAAGAYQILKKTWDECVRALSLPDFSPSSQDAAAVYLIKRRKALEDVQAGRIRAAVAKCANEWASLPGNSYNQNPKTIEEVIKIYKTNGGEVA